jgi:hypothetical protein
MSELIFNYYRRFYQLCISSQPINSLSAHRQCSNGNFVITRMLDQSNLSTQRCRLIFWGECSLGGYLILAQPLVILRI